MINFFQKNFNHHDFSHNFIETKIFVTKKVSGGSLTTAIMRFTLKLGQNMNFCIFWRPLRGIFASREPNMSSIPITPYIRWKACVHNFQKFLKIEVGQLHALEGFLTEKNRKNAKYMIRINGQKPPRRGVMRKNVLHFLLNTL